MKKFFPIFNNENGSFQKSNKILNQSLLFPKPFKEATFHLPQMFTNDKKIVVYKTENFAEKSFDRKSFHSFLWIDPWGQS